MQGTVDVFHASKGRMCIRSVPTKGLSKPLLQDSIEESGEAKTCRICHMEPDKDGEPFLSPCWCSGSVQYVCRECLGEWRRKNFDQRVSCELCGFAFCYEYESVPANIWVWALLNRHWTTFMYFTIALVLQISFIFSFQPIEPMPFMASLAIVVELAFDLHNSVGNPEYGSFGYSLKRLTKGTDVEAMDLWELHKNEWARGGLKVYMNQGGGSLSGLRSCLEAIGLLLVLSCLFTYINLPHQFFSWLMSDKGQHFMENISRPALFFELAYLTFAVCLHSISMSRSPPIRLLQDSDNEPTVRSLLAHERRNKLIPSESSREQIVPKESVENSGVNASDNSV